MNIKDYLDYRYLVLLALAAIGLIGIFANPSEDLSLFVWLLAKAFGMAVGFGAFYAGAQLMKLWEEEDAEKMENKNE